MKRTKKGPVPGEAAVQELKTTKRKKGAVPDMKKTRRKMAAVPDMKTTAAVPDMKKTKRKMAAVPDMKKHRLKHLTGSRGRVLAALKSRINRSI